MFFWNLGNGDAEDFDGAASTQADGLIPAASDELVEPEPEPERVLMVVVPGTGSGDDVSWARVVEGRVSFASELARGYAEANDDRVRPEVVVEVHQWKSPNSHRLRRVAAEDLAAVLRREAQGYDRVFLVGHSHGGNVAALAAGEAQMDGELPIDGVVMLSTPHLHLTLRYEDEPGDQGGAGGAEPVLVPVYLTAEAYAAVEAFWSVRPTGDGVVGFYAGLMTGVKDHEATGLTVGWRRGLGFPGLLHDPVIATPLTKGNLAVRDRPRVSGRVLDKVHHVEVLSTAEGLWETSGMLLAHDTVHSRRMGYVLGRALRQGPTWPVVERLSRSVLRDRDGGRGIDAAAFEAERAARPGVLVGGGGLDGDRLLGYRLRRLRVYLTSDAEAKTGESVPELAVEWVSEPVGEGYGVGPRSYERSSHVVKGGGLDWFPDQYVAVLGTRQTMRVVDR
ncbi:MAG: alpha/beta fold hydrolase, partial [Planctomycetota bacterium]